MQALFYIIIFLRELMIAKTISFEKMLSKTIATKNGGPNYAIKNYIIQVPVIAKTISLPEKDSKNYIIWDSCDL